MSFQTNENWFWKLLTFLLSQKLVIKSIVTWPHNYCHQTSAIPVDEGAKNNDLAVRELLESPPPKPLATNLFILHIYISWIYISDPRSRYQVSSCSQISWHWYIQCWASATEVVKPPVCSLQLVYLTGWGVVCTMFAEILLTVWCLSSDYVFQSCMCSSYIVSRTIEGSFIWKLDHFDKSTNAPLSQTSKSYIISFVVSFYLRHEVFPILLGYYGLSLPWVPLLFTVIDNRHSEFLFWNALTYLPD